MSHRHLLVAAALVLGAAPGVAQDPTNAVRGSGELPAGWMVRFDPSRPGRPVPTIADVNFRTAGGGLQHTSGPAGVFYRTEPMSGGFTVGATFTQTKSMQHEAYGLVFGGRDMQTPNQNYLYFIIHPQDGKFLINHRVGDARPVPVVPYTVHSAIRKDAEGTGAATNTLAIHVAPDTVHFIVNGTVVQGLAKSQLNGASTDGLVGLRLNHNLDLSITSWLARKDR